MLGIKIFKKKSNTFSVYNLSGHALKHKNPAPRAIHNFGRTFIGHHYLHSDYHINVSRYLKNLSIFTVWLIWVTQVTLNSNGLGSNLSIQATRQVMAQFRLEHVQARPNAPGLWFVIIQEIIVLFSVLLCVGWNHESFRRCQHIIQIHPFRICKIHGLTRNPRWRQSGIWLLEI